MDSFDVSAPIFQRVEFFFRVDTMAGYDDVDAIAQLMATNKLPNSSTYGSVS